MGSCFSAPELPWNLAAPYPTPRARSTTTILLPRFVLAAGLLACDWTCGRARFDVVRKARASDWRKTILADRGVAALARALIVYMVSQELIGGREWVVCTTDVCVRKSSMQSVATLRQASHVYKFPDHLYVRMMVLPRVPGSPGCCGDPRSAQPSALACRVAMAALR